MVFGTTCSGLWNGLKGFCGINNVIPKVRAQYDNTTVGNRASNPWEKMIIRGPNPYTKTEKLLNDVLDQYRDIDNITVNRRYTDESGKLAVNIKHVNEIANNNHSLSLRVDTEVSDMFKTYVHVGDKQCFGIKFKSENDIISGDVGLRKKFADCCVDTISVKSENDIISGDFGIPKKVADCSVDNALYADAQFKHPSIFVDAKCKVSKFNRPDERSFDMELSNVFGHEFNRFGALAGFKLKFNNSEHFKWQNMCQSVTFGLVCPVAANQFTFKPNDGVCVLDSYWKVNHKFEVATSLKANWRNPEWINRDHEFGVKYKHSDDLTCKLKTDFSGKISAGLLMMMENSIKLGFYLQSNVRNFGEGSKVGCSIEF